MSSNALSDLEVEVVDEIVEEGFFSKDQALARSCAQTKAISMEETVEADSELFLTDYLLNFGEESSRECYYDGCSSGVECSENEDDCSLASLKKSLEKAKRDNGGNGEFPTFAGKNNECLKSVCSSFPVKNEAGKTSSLLSNQNKKAVDKESNRKARDRARAAKNRLLKVQRQKKVEEECVELRENNKVLFEEKIALNKKILKLEEQVEYLENVIANQSALSTILNTLSEHSGLKFQSNSLRLNCLKRKREDIIDMENGNDSKKKKEDGKSGGVCVHLAPGRMSLAFCQECHRNAMKDEEE